MYWRLFYYPKSISRRQIEKKYKIIHFVLFQAFQSFPIFCSLSAYLLAQHHDPALQPYLPRTYLFTPQSDKHTFGALHVFFSAGFDVTMKRKIRR
jgi:hypothetical protein